MKNISLFIILFLTGKLIYAQDTIVKKNNEIIQAKIMEITQSEIKYKKYTFLDGPTYIENKSEIQYIRFSNGLKEEFSSTPAAPASASASKVEPEASANADYYNPNMHFSNGPQKMEPYGVRYKYQGRKISESEMQKILMKTQDKQIISYVQNAKDARAMSYIGFAAFPLGVGSLYFLANSVNSSNTLNNGSFAASILCLGGAIACPIISGIYKHKRSVNNRKAVELYNQKF